MSKVEEVKVETLKIVLRQFQSDVFEYNHQLESKRLGKVLTIIDGSIADETQRKAVKDLVNDSWYSARPVKIYPTVSQVSEALGFEIHESPDIAPPQSLATYNPYIKLVNK
jgi:hypothetical protein